VLSSGAADFSLLQSDRGAACFRPALRAKILHSILR
jgi:hypothetical protein